MVPAPAAPIGARVRRVEDPRLIRGEGRYVGDIRPAGTLSVAFVRSPHAHARIVRVDADRARSARGVVAVYLAGDLPGLGRPMPVVVPMPGVAIRMPPPLAKSEALYVGEAIAAIVAETPAAAADAAELVEITYEPLPAAVDPRQAMADGAPLVHPGVERNVAARLERTTGDPEAAFARAEVVVREQFSAARATGAAIEPRGALAIPGSDGRMDVTLWDSTQAPHVVRSGLAGILECPKERVRVATPDVGGGFGPKGRLYSEEAVLALIARHLQRPVAWTATRQEDTLTTYAGRGLEVEAEVAARRDGTLLGLRARLVQDAGAYLPVALVVPQASAQHLLGPYRWRGFSAEIVGVYTHKVPLTPLRGGGRELGVFVTERLMDRLAQEIGADPVALRLRNVLRADEFPYDTGYPSSEGGTVVFDSGDYPAYLRRARELIGMDAVRAAQPAERASGRYRGVAVTAFLESTGRGPEGARVQLTEDGTVRLTAGSPSTGQSHATTLSQVCAARLGVPMGLVRAADSGDTASGVPGVGTFASRVAMTAGNAVAGAARRLREQLLRAASMQLEAAAEDLVLDGGRVSVRGLPARGVTLAALARWASEHGHGDLLAVDESFDPRGKYSSAGGAHGAVVEVDAETGLVLIQRYVVVHDCGSVLNPTVVEGQVEGGVAHGIGNALMESLLYDDQGQLLTGDWGDYALPTAYSLDDERHRARATVPPIEVVHVEHPSPFNPEGIKGAGEGGTIGALATIAGAVEDALAPWGVRVTHLPIRSSDLVAAIHKATA